MEKNPTSTLQKKTSKTYPLVYYNEEKKSLPFLFQEEYGIQIHAHVDVLLDLLCLVL